MSSSKHHRKLEDGILKSLHNCNKYQIKSILEGSLEFKYYTLLNEERQLNSFVKIALREAKIESLGI